MKFQRAWFTVLAALLVAACASKGPDYVDAGASPESLAKDYVAADKTEGVKGTTRVAIPYFQVEVVYRSGATGTASAYSGKGATATQIYELQGISDADMQALTDRLYDALVADLTAAGIQVMPHAELAALPAYQALSEIGNKVPYLQETSSSGHRTASKFFSARGGTLYFDPDDQRVSLGSQLGKMFNMKRPAKQYENDLQKAAGVPLLRARYLVDIAAFEASKGGLFSGGSSASVSAAVAVTLASEFTRLSFVPVGGYSKWSMAGPVFKLVRPVLNGDTAWVKGTAEINAVANRAGEAVGTLLNVAAQLSGGSGFGTAKRREYGVTADPAAWGATVEKTVGLTNKMLLSQVKGEL